MPHAIPPDFRKGDLYATLFANDPAIFHALVLATQALVIFDWAKDTSTEQPVSFGLESAIVNCLRLLDFAKRPRVNSFRAGDRDADLIETLRPADLPKDIHQFVHQRPLFIKPLEPLARCRRHPGGEVWSSHLAKVTAWERDSLRLANDVAVSSCVAPIPHLGPASAVP